MSISETKAVMAARLKAIREMTTDEYWLDSVSLTTARQMEIFEEIHEYRDAVFAQSQAIQNARSRVSDVRRDKARVFIEHMPAPPACDFVALFKRAQVAADEVNKALAVAELSDGVRAKVIYDQMVTEFRSLEVSLKSLADDTGELMPRDEFDKEYKPFYPDGDSPYWETYGSQLAAVLAHTKTFPNRVLTVIDHDGTESGLAMWPGYHDCDAVGYILTTNPYPLSQMVEY